jgi:hypothetical protein
MACITLFAPMAMATTQLARVVRYENASSSHLVDNWENNLLRMSWVVATDDNGNRCLRMHWMSVEDC